MSSEPDYVECFAQKFLFELNQVKDLYPDVEIYTNSDREPLKISAIILAAVSPMLCEALVTVQNEEAITIYVENMPKVSLEYFFQSLFNWSFDSSGIGVQELEIIHSVLEIFSINLNLLDGPFSKPVAQVLINPISKNFSCDKCGSSFVTNKLLKRHKR